MSEGASRTHFLNRFIKRFLDESSFIREYAWKYRGLVALGLFSLLVVDGLEVLPPIFLKRAVDLVSSDATGQLRMLAVMAGAYLVVSFFQALGRYGWRMYLIRASMYSGRDLRTRFARHLFGLSSSFFDRTKIGDLMTLATSDVEAVRAMLGPGLLTLADSFFGFVTIPFAMIWLSPKLALLAFLPLPIIPWLVMRNEREIHRRYEKVQEAFGDISAMVQENLNGVRVVKGFAKEATQMERFRKAGAEFVQLNLHLARVQTAFGPTLDFTMSLGLVALLFVGGRYLIHGSSVESAITLGTFVAFQRYIQKMVWPMAAFGMAVSSYQRAVSSSERLGGVFAQATDVPESPSATLPGAQLAAHATGWKTPGGVEMRNLSFRFPNSARDENSYVLRDISLKIEPRERVAFIGTIGAGKSALLSLLPRLYPVSSGMLFVDGVDVNDWPIDELRRQVGYVGQDVFLFSETVIENLAYGLAERALLTNTPMIEQATQLAFVHEEVLGLAGSYRTRLGERGVNLSGGQKQRLTIARALAKQPSILVLDDALSSVDVQTEEKILEGLRSRAGRNTEIIAAHRISTIKDADRIVVIEGGTIRQIGTHADLVADRRGAYRQYYDQQLLKEDLESYAEEISEVSEVLL